MRASVSQFANIIVHVIITKITYLMTMHLHCTVQNGFIGWETQLEYVLMNMAYTIHKRAGDQYFIQWN